jgi:hypothetical protein
MTTFVCDHEHDVFNVTVLKCLQKSFCSSTIPDVPYMLPPSVFEIVCTANVLQAIVYKNRIYTFAHFKTLQKWTQKNQSRNMFVNILYCNRLLGLTKNLMQYWMTAQRCLLVLRGTRTILSIMTRIANGLIWPGTSTILLVYILLVVWHGMSYGANQT